MIGTQNKLKGASEMLRINDYKVDYTERVITYTTFKKELNLLIKETGYKVSSFEKALSGSKYICISKTDRYDEISFIRIADHSKSFQSEGPVSVITNEKNMYAEIIAYIANNINEIKEYLINY